ncbi:hypothetical protein WA158_006343 [Blastocystis sp. Blastoise]
MVIKLFIYFFFFAFIDASICGRKFCRDCVKASDYVDGWNGSFTDLPALNCSYYLGNDWKTVPAKSIDDYGNYISPSTFDIYKEYNEWYLEYGTKASSECIEATKKLYCMNQYPPCESSKNYALYPCNDTCIEYHEICKDSSSPACPIDQLIHSKIINNNNNQYNNDAQASCYYSNYTIEPAKCLFNPFTCQNGGKYHPECTRCVCPSNRGGLFCDECKSNEQCNSKTQMDTTEQTQVCYTQPYFVHPDIHELTCYATQLGLVYNLFGETTIRTLSSLQCSQYISDGTTCKKCSEGLCHVYNDTYWGIESKGPIFSLFRNINSTSIFGCFDNEQCIWMQKDLFSQDMVCSTGTCVVTENDNGKPVYIHYLYILLFIIPIIIFAFVIYFTKPANKPAPKPINGMVFKRPVVADYKGMPRINEELGEDTIAIPKEEYSTLVEIYWSDIDLYVENNIIFSCNAGTMSNQGINAILGPKQETLTLFLRCLSGQYVFNSRGYVEKGFRYSGNMRARANGKVYIASELVTSKTVNQLVAFIGKDCELCMAMTVKEILEYNLMQTNLPKDNKKDTEDRIYGYLKELGLEEYKNYVIQDVPYQQRVILRIGLEVMLNKHVILIDDALTSFSPDCFSFIMNYLYKLTMNGIIVGITFNTLPACSLSCCPNMNRLDDIQLDYIFMNFKQTVNYHTTINALRIMDTDHVPLYNYTSEDSITAPFLEDTDNHGDNSSLQHLFQTHRIPSLSYLLSPQVDLYINTIKKSSWSCFSSIFIRITKVMIRERKYLLYHTLLGLCSGILFGLLFFHLQNNRNGIDSRSNLFYLMTIFVYSTGFSSSSWFTSDISSYEREHWSNQYSTTIYNLAYTLCDFIALRMIPSLVFIIPVVLFAGLCPDPVLMVSIPSVLLMFLILCLSSTLASIIYSTIYLYTHYDPKIDPRTQYNYYMETVLTFFNMLLFSNYNSSTIFRTVLTFIAPPLLTYRSLMITELSNQMFYVHIIGNEGASALISGEMILSETQIGLPNEIAWYILDISIWILFFCFIRERLLSAIHIHNIWKDRRMCCCVPHIENKDIYEEKIIDRNSDILSIGESDIERVEDDSVPISSSVINETHRLGSL